MVVERAHALAGWCQEVPHLLGEPIVLRAVDRDIDDAPPYPPDPHCSAGATEDPGGQAGSPREVHGALRQKCI